MQFYSLHQFEPPFFKTNHSLHQPIKPKRFKTSRNNQQCYGCSLNSQNTIFLWKFDLQTGKTSKVQARTNLGKIAEATVCSNYLVIRTKQNVWGCARLEKIWRESKQQIAILQAKTFDYLSLMITHNEQTRNISYLVNEYKIVGAYLSGESLIFQEMSSDPTSNLKIHLNDLNQTQATQLLALETCNQDLFNKQCSNQLIVAVLKIRKKQKESSLIVLEILWSKKQYQIHQIFIQEEQPSLQQTLKVCSLSHRILAIATEKIITLCQRNIKGWNTLFAITTDYLLEGMIGIDEQQNKCPQLLIFGKTKTENISYLYDIITMWRGLQLLPLKINAESNLNQCFQGFIKLSSCQVLLFLSNSTYLYGPSILKLTKLILTNRVNEESQDFEENSIEDYGLFDPQHHSNISFIPFQQFIRQCKQHIAETENYVNQLSSPLLLKKAITSFDNIMYKTLPFGKGDNWILTNYLLRQYALIALFLTNLINYINSDHQSEQYLPVPANNDYLFNSIWSLTLANIPLVEQPQINRLFFKTGKKMKENLLSVLTFLTVTSNTSAKISSFSKENYQFGEIIKDLCFDQMLQILTGQSKLQNRVVFLMYCASKKQDYHKWTLCSKLLKQLLSIRKDYHPLYGLICKNLPLYTINKFHLQYCSALNQKQQKQLEPISCLGNINYAASKYLQSLNLDHLTQFVSPSYNQQKQNSQTILIPLPKKQLDSVISQYLIDTVQIRGKKFIKLTQQSILLMLQKMQKKNDLLLHIDSQSLTITLSQKLHLTNRLFIQQLLNKYQSKSEIRKENKNIRYNCICYTNQQYCNLINSSLITRINPKMNKQSENITSQAIADRYFSRLLQIADEYLLFSFFDYPQHEEDLFSNRFSDKLSEPLNMSQIISAKSAENHEHVNLLLKYLWDLYQNLSQISQTQFQVDEQLFHPQFVEKFIGVLAKITEYLQQKYQNLFEIVSQSSITLDPLKKIRTALRSSKKVALLQKSIKSTDQTQQFIKIVLQIYIISKIYPISAKWIFSFDDLIIESAILQIPLPQTHLQAISYFFDLIIF